MDRFVQIKSNFAPIFRNSALICSVLAMGYPSVLFAQAKSAVLEQTNYDFAYSVLGDKTLVTQAFDNGKKTYLSIPKNTTQAEINNIVNSAIVTTGEQSLPITIYESQPYLVADGVFENMIIAVDNRVVSISYKGNKHRPPLQLNEQLATLPEEPKKTKGKSGSAPAPLPANGAVQGVSKQVAADFEPMIDLRASPFETLPPATTRGKPAPVQNNKPLPPLPGKTENPRGIDESASHVETLDVTPKPQEGQRFFVPFAEGKTTLGKEGNRAANGLIEMALYCREVKIVAPTDADTNDLDKAITRSLEIQKRLLKSGLTEQKYVIGTSKGIGSDKTVFAEVVVTGCGK